jgi:hypothetical protein
MNLDATPAPVLPANGSPADWCGRRVKLKGLVGGRPEIMMVAELVGVSEIGLVLSWKGHRTFFPWATVVSLSLDEEPRA